MSSLPGIHFKNMSGKQSVQSVLSHIILHTHAIPPPPPPPHTHAIPPSPHTHNTLPPHLPPPETSLPPSYSLHHHALSPLPRRSLHHCYTVCTLINHHSHHHHHHAGLSIVQIARKIARDSLDVLIDLDGLTSSAKDGASRSFPLIHHCYTVCALIHTCYTVCALINHCYTVSTLINHCYPVSTLSNHCYR
jgi:hypothetical protein